MAEVMYAENISLAGQFAEFSFSIEGESISAILAPKEETSLFLTRLLVGSLLPESGIVRLFGRNTASLSRKELLRMRQRIGIAYSSGGLISNLKVWENLSLPLSFHSALTPAEIEERGLRILKRFNYSGGLMELPGPLSTYQKRILGFARAMMGDPDIMIYESPTRGLNAQERNLLIDAALDFHREKPGRTSLFLTSDQASPNLLRVATIFNVTKGNAA